MSVVIIEKQSKRTGALSAVIVVESENIDEVNGVEARTAAVQYAEKLGLNSPGINKSSGALPFFQNQVLETGEDFERYRQDCLLYGKNARLSYINEITVSSASLSAR